MQNRLNFENAAIGMGLTISFSVYLTEFWRMSNSLMSIFEQAEAITFESTGENAAVKHRLMFEGSELNKKVISHLIIQINTKMTEF